MAKKSSGTAKDGFKDPSCEHCSWGPTTDIEFDLPHGVKVSLGNTCAQCIQCFESAARGIIRLHGTDAFYPLISWMQMEGFNFVLTEP
jgi:hypothetical protein